MTRSHCLGTVQDRYGNVVEGASVTVRQPGTATVITDTLYAGATGDTDLDNPLTTDENGGFGFYLDTPQTVDFYVSGADVTARTIAGAQISTSSGSFLLVVVRPTSAAGSLTAAYATAAEYRARCDSTVSTDDATILEDLTAVSRFFEVRTKRFFTKDSAPVTRSFAGNGRRKLWLPVDIASATGLVVKADLDGDYDFDDSIETLTLNRHFWLGPRDAAKGPEAWPFQYLQVRPAPDNGALDVWPDQEEAVQVTAIYGWPAVPGAIKAATIGITRQLREMLSSGPTLTLENISAGIQMSPRMSFLLRDIERMYGRGR